MAISLTAKSKSSKTVMLHLSPELYARIQNAAKRHKLPAAVAMRQMLEQAIDEIESNEA